MMSLWDALRMNMMISYQELVRTFLRHFVFLVSFAFRPLKLNHIAHRSLPFSNLQIVQIHTIFQQLN